MAQLNVYTVDDDFSDVDVLQSTNTLQPTKLVDVKGNDVGVLRLENPQRLRPATQGQLPRPATKEFEIHVEKRSGVGIDVTKCKDGQAILVARIKEGAVQDWNNANVAAGRTDRVMYCGDRIVSVNSSGRGDAEEVLAALTSASSTVTMKIVRHMEFQVWNLPNFPRDLLGLEYEENDLGHLALTKVGFVANKALQQDVELRPGDLIVKVNGSTEMLRADIMSHDTLTLRIRRPD